MEKKKFPPSFFSIHQPSTISRLEARFSPPGGNAVLLYNDPFGSAQYHTRGMLGFMRLGWGSSAVEKHERLSVV